MEQTATIKLRLDPGNVTPASQQAAASIGKIGEAGQTSARQTAAAMRQLPAQFTDIVTSLQGGQSPITVLLQQGGQIKDSFGGIGPALSGLAGMVTPTAVAFGALAAVFGTVAYAAHEAAKQSSELRDTLAISGNAAGLTGARLQSLSQSVADSSQQTVGGARDILIALAASGQVSNKELGAVATAVARVSDVTGQDSKKVAADFATMGGGVAKWAAEHNKAWNFISLEQYKHIRRLEEQGRAEEAMIVVSEAVDDAMKDQAKQLSQLGKALDSVAKKWSEMWLAARGLVNEKTPQEKIEQARNDLKNILDSAGGKDPVAGSYSAARVGQLRDQITMLAEQAKQEKTAADKKSAIAAANRKAIAAAQAADGQHAAADRKGRPYFPSGPDAILDARDAMVEAAKWESEQGRVKAFFDEAERAQDERDEKRLTANAQFQQQLVDANARASIELMQDERARGEALIELDRSIAVRRLQEKGLEGGLRSQALDEISEQSLNARRKLELDLRKSEDRLAEETGKALYTDVRDSLTAAFRDTHNPIQAFASALGAAVFSRLTASLADAIATAAVGGNGQGGLLGDLLKTAGSIYGGGLPVDTTGGTFNDIIPGRPRGGMATGTNLVPRDMFLFAHRGEAIIPAKYNPAAGGAGPRAQQVVINNYTGAQVRTQTRDDGDTSILEVMIEAAVGEVDRRILSGGSTARALRSRGLDTARALQRRA